MATPRLEWHRIPRANGERARTPIGDYIITFSGWDHILAFHPTDGPSSVIHRYLAPGHLKTVSAPADLNRRLNPPPAEPPAPRTVTTDAVIDQIVQAVADAIDWTDGSNAHTEIRQGLTVGLAATNHHIAPNGGPNG
jgi:hypothetical protein